MRQLLQALVLMAGLLFIPVHALASPEVDRMSDIEVSEYAVQMSKVIEEIQYRELCVAQDTSCVRPVYVLSLLVMVFHMMIKHQYKNVWR